MSAAAHPLGAARAALRDPEQRNCYVGQPVELLAAGLIEDWMLPRGEGRRQWTVHNEFGDGVVIHRRAHGRLRVIYHRYGNGEPEVSYKRLEAQAGETVRSILERARQGVGS